MLFLLFLFNPSVEWCLTSYRIISSSEAKILIYLSDSCTIYVHLILPIFLFQEEIKTKEIKQTIGTISDLAPSTLYCVKVQAFSKAYNKSSPFSKEECIKTPGGRKSLGIVTLLGVKLLTLHRPLQVSLVKKILAA